MSKKPKAEKSMKPWTRDQTLALAKCCLFALNHLNTKGGGVVMDFATMKTSRWQDQFFDALDGIGVEVDRDAYWKSSTKKSRRAS